VAKLHRAAVAEVGAGRFSSAVSQLTAAIYLAPRDAELYALRGEAHLKLCDFASAAANLRKALALVGDGAAIAPEWRRRLVGVLDLRAVSLLEEGAHAEAEAQLSEALAIDRSHLAPWVHRAVAHAALQDFDAASSDLAVCVEIDPHDADVHFLRAKVALLAGDLPGARAAADMALAILPDHPEARTLRQTMAEAAGVYTDEATKLILLGAPEDAVGNLTHAMALRPDDAELVMRRGTAYRQLGQHTDAADDFERAVELAGGKYPEAVRLLTLTFNDLGIALAAQGRHGEAAAWFDRAVRADPTVCQYHLNRGDCHKALGSVEEALADFEAAKALTNGEAAAEWDVQCRIALVHNERGTQLFNRGAARRAGVEFSRAIECNPKVAGFYTNRAQATLALRRFDLAKDDLLAALRLNPDDEAAQRMLSSLCPGR
jgi:tetratricopeptide (TPR) repeat protein